MATPDNCCSPCNIVPPVNVPGMQGPAGNNGTNGTNGINAFDFTTAPFNIPPDNVTNVTIQVAVGVWMTPGQFIAITGIVSGEVGIFQVVSVTGTAIVLSYPAFAENTNYNDTIPSGTQISPSGGESTATVTIAKGGTGATTKASAQTDLGLGQNAIISSSSGLTQAITGSNTQIGSIDIQITATGEYLYLAHFTVVWIGVTFPSGTNNITTIIRNITQGVTLATAIRLVPASVTTTSFPTTDYHLPFVIDSTAAVNDHIQLQIVVGTLNSAGTFEVTAGSLCAVPLRLN